MTDLIARLSRALVVSCQAPDESPLCSPEMMAAMARAAAIGGATGIRAEGCGNIAAIRAAVDLPLIGIRKLRDRPFTEVFITPGFTEAQEVARAGADIIAVDGTARPRPGSESLPELISRIHIELGCLVMADVDTVESGEHAADAGADLVSTTLSGYTGGPTPEDPDLGLIAELRTRLDTPIVAEGRLWTREHVLAAFEAGAHTAVVGSAITNPILSTRRIVSAL